MHFCGVFVFITRYIATSNLRRKTHFETVTCVVLDVWTKIGRIFNVRNGGVDTLHTVGQVTMARFFMFY